MADDLIIDEPLDDQPLEGGDIERLTATLAKVRAEAKQYKRAAQKASGIDPEIYAQMVAEKEEREELEATRKGDFDKLLGAEKARASAAEKKLQATLAKANESMIDNILSTEFVKAGGKAEHLDNYKVLAKSKLTKDADGAYVLPDGDDGEPLEWGAYVTSTRDNGLGFAFDPINKSKGSGQIGGKEPASAGIKTISPAEAGKYIKEIAAGTVTIKS